MRVQRCRELGNLTRVTQLVKGRSYLWTNLCPFDRKVQPLPITHFFFHIHFFKLRDTSCAVKFSLSGSMSLNRGMCIYHHNQDIEHWIYGMLSPNIPPYGPFVITLLPSKVTGKPIWFLSLQFCLFSIFIWMKLCSRESFESSFFHLRSTHVIEYQEMFLSFYCCIALHCLRVFLLVHSFASWRLFASYSGCFQICVTMNEMSVNTHVNISFSSSWINT